MKSPASLTVHFDDDTSGHRFCDVSVGRRALVVRVELVARGARDVDALAQHARAVGHHAAHGHAVAEPHDRRRGIT